MPQEQCKKCDVKSVMNKNENKLNKQPMTEGKKMKVPMQKMYAHTKLIGL